MEKQFKKLVFLSCYCLGLHQLLTQFPISACWNQPKQPNGGKKPDKERIILFFLGK